MKKFFLHCIIGLSVYFSLVTLVACSSIEDKANKVIKEDMYNYLIDYDSYQPVETKVDSLMNNIYGDTIIFDQIMTYNALKREVDKYGWTQSESAPIADIWSDVNYAEYSNNEFKKMSEQDRDAFKCLGSNSDLWETISSNIDAASKGHSDGSFYGYLVTHKFRCKNRDGQVTLNCYRYFIDKEFSKIIRKFGEDYLSYEKYKLMIDDALVTAKAESLKFKGKMFLIDNAKKNGVIVLTSGLQYRIITTGNGKQPSAISKVKLHYDVRTIEGKVLFSNFDKDPVESEILHLIPGMVEALPLMSVGSIWELYIPQDLAFGERENLTGLPGLEPYSTIISKIELVDIIE